MSLSQRRYAGRVRRFFFRLPTLEQLRSRPLDAHADTRMATHFQVLQACYSALEELHFPVPAGFHTTFAIWGFHSLPRQYDHRTVARVAWSDTSGRLTGWWDGRWALEPPARASVAACSCSTSTAVFSGSRTPQSTISCCAPAVRASPPRTAISRRDCLRTSVPRCRCGPSPPRPSPETQHACPAALTPGVLCAEVGVRAFANLAQGPGIHARPARK